MLALLLLRTVLVLLTLLLLAPLLAPLLGPLLVLLELLVVLLLGPLLRLVLLVQLGEGGVGHVEAHAGGPRGGVVVARQAVLVQHAVCTRKRTGWLR